jgi:hypothetical protein
MPRDSEYPDYMMFLWNRDPEAMERLTRNGLRIARPDRVSDAGRLELQIALVSSLIFQRRLEEALSITRIILENDPVDKAGLWFETQLAFLMNEPWPRPWKLLDKRWELLGLPRPVERSQIWDCSALNCRRVLLAGEAGLGDQIQFIRFAPMLRNAGAGEITVSASPKLLPLFRTMKGVDRLVPSSPYSAKPSEGVDFDVAVPMMSAPGLLEITRETMPADVPYLQPMTKAIESARCRMLREPGRELAVGLCWQSVGRTKVIPLKLLVPLFHLPGVHFYGLGESSQIEAECSAFGIFNLGGDIESTAGAIAALDLVISVDTMVAHLAGSLGAPVWLLLNYVPDWRWGITGEDTPWYPTMRLFRRESCGWEALVQRVKAELVSRRDNGFADYGNRCTDA